MSIEAMKQALEALKLIDEAMPFPVAKYAMSALRTAIAEAEKQRPVKLWLWKNFVDGKPEYWAFDNPFPCVSVGGDPLTLGEPCGWALLKPSVNGRPDRLEQEVIDTVTRFATPPAAQRQWVGLTEAEINEWDYDTRDVVIDIEKLLREKNT